MRYEVERKVTYAATLALKKRYKCATRVMNEKKNWRLSGGKIKINKIKTQHTQKKR